ncbi:uncharacterized protein LOC143352389 isoform X9 [Halictus rubicundus]|uniref:uncharacterized protein LOC143352389 isoform X9 n=1 Tax=Halictus rubicundus TaxID=77578 RepID=UPI004035D836
MSRNTISQSVKYGLHFIGIWPDTPLPGLRKVLWLLSAAFCQFCQYKYAIKHINTDGFVDTIYSLGTAMAYTSTVGYLVIAWINHGVLREIISAMEDDCAKYAPFDRNNAISRTADLSYRLTSTIPALHLLAAFCVAVGTLVIPQANNSNDRKLVIDMDVPFDLNQSPTYELVLAAQFIFQGVVGYTYSMFSTILLMLAVQVENGLPVIVRCSVLYFAVWLEIFVYCFAGEYLNTKSKMIVDAIYDTSWYNLQPTTGRGLVLLILKSQAGLPLTIGKFSSLSLQTFANFMKASMSYMGVLFAMS